MAIAYEKVNDTDAKITITESKVTETITNLGRLKSIAASYQARIDEFTAKKAEIDKDIAELVKLGVKESSTITGEPQ